MSNYPMNNDCQCAGYSVVNGNSLDIDVNYCESEIRADVVVSEYDSVRLWGRIVNCEGKPVANALIKLLKVTCHKNGVSYNGVAHTLSDCDGFYQFELCRCSDEEFEKCCYKILVSKAAYGPERVVPISGGNCNPCDNNGFDPCKEYKPIITPPGSGCCNEDNFDGGCGCNSCFSKSKY